MSYEPLHHKYRPQRFADLVGQNAIAQTLSNAINQQKIAPAYLFTGPRGTGKTSSARILAKSLNCQDNERPTSNPCGKCEVCRTIASGTALDVIEIDAASNTGVDNIREVIERAQFAPVQCRYKVYVIDECHMLSTAAFNALLKTLEEPPPNVIFVLATTDPQRVLSTIISRCQRFDYRRIPLQEIVAHLRYISRQESINITEDALTLVAQIANGGLRDAESLLDQLSLLPETVTVEKIWDLVGAVSEQDLLSLLQAIRQKNPEQILQKCRNLLDRGREPLVVLQNLAGFYLNLLIAKTAAHRSDLVALTETTWQSLVAEANHWEVNLILQGQQELKEGEGQLRHTTQPRLWLEVILLGLLKSSKLESNLDHQSVEVRSSQTKATVVDTEQEKSISHTKTESVSLPQASTTLSSQSSPQELTKPISLAKESEPEAIAPRRDEAEIASELIKEANSSEDFQPIWLKAIELVQPPTTQALLIQQCYLSKIEASLVTIAISSNSLSKLLQGKVANIETAFSRVCQKKMKVQFEVGSATKTEKKNLNNDLTEIKKANLNHQTAHEILAASSTTTLEAPQIQKIADVEIIAREKDLLVSSSKENLMLSTNDLQNNFNSQSDRLETVVVEKYEIELEGIIARQDDLSSEADFQKAIEVLLENFEGEIALLEEVEKEVEADPHLEDFAHNSNNLRNNWQSSTQIVSTEQNQLSQTTEAKQEQDSILDLTETAKKIISNNWSKLSQAIDKEEKNQHHSVNSSTDRQTIISDRPNLSNYEEDDLPF